MLDFQSCQSVLLLSAFQYPDGVGNVYSVSVLSSTLPDAVHFLYKVCTTQYR